MVLDATFEVSEAPLPLLYISLSASQNLYTRRGTLVGIGGKADNVSEFLTLLDQTLNLPLVRWYLRYQF